MNFTGITDCDGQMIERDDIISVIHQSEHFGEVEFRYRVVWKNGGYMINDKTYLGTIRDNPNFLRCKVLGKPNNLLNIIQGYPAGYTERDVNRIIQS